MQARPGEDPKMFELPPWYISRVSIKHSEAPWLWEMGIKWTGMPLESGLELSVGGLQYTAVPHSCWCAPHRTRVACIRPQHALADSLGAADLNRHGYKRARCWCSCWSSFMAASVP